MRAALVPLDGGKTIPIVQDVTIVGRKRGVCDVVIDRGSVSKLQCVIVKTDGLLFVRDLASTNGTRVNGQKVTRGALLPGDELSFASVRYRVELGPGEPDVGPGERTEMLTNFDAHLKSDRLDDHEFEDIPNDSNSDSDVRLLEG